MLLYTLSHLHRAGGTCDIGKVHLPCSVGGKRMCWFRRNHYTSEMQCEPYRQCLDGQYMHREEVVDASGYLVRPQTCRTYTECGVDEFIKINGRDTEKRDNLCVPFTPPCSEEEYESKSTSISSDRVCTPLTQCGDDEFEEIPNTLYQDRKCTSRTSCGDGQFIRNLGSATEDNDCQAHTPCTGGYGEAIPGDGSTDRVCQLCEAGYYGLQAGDGGEPCKACDSNSYQPDPGQETCIPKTVCSDDYLFAGNITHDATCMEGVCPETWRRDFFATIGGVDRYLCTRCKDGFYIEGEDCLVCPENHYCPTYLLAKVPCSRVTTYTAGESTFTVPYAPEGSTSPFACSCARPGFHGVSQGIQGCSACPPGLYSNASSTECESCPLDYYVETETVHAGGLEMTVNIGCLPCPSDRPYTHAHAHNESDCLSYRTCPDGMFWDESGGGCTPCSACGARRTVQACGVDHDAECGDCGLILLGTKVCAAGFRLPKCAEDDCLPCLNELPAHASWKTGIGDAACTWACDAGFYELQGACLPCSEPCTKQGLTRIACSGRADAACGSPCKNLTKPLLGSTWVVVGENNCAWECLPGREPLLSTETGIYTCAQAI